ncbi:MAG: phosphoribosylglycinamide formyltransferase [Thermoplasmata archaeon]|nr:phosphoribosylglycinamide formyltransferase [Thermoplasmata archaeon]
MTFNICVLASGGGTDLQSILDACESGQIKGRVKLVIANNKNAFALDRGKKYGAEGIFIDHRGITREEHEIMLAEEIDNNNIDLIVLAGYLRMFTPFFVQRYMWKIINIHPALLPDFGGPGFHGMKVHKAVLESGNKVSGCSVHFVMEEVDGGPVISMQEVPVLKDDNPETLQARVLEKEHELLPLVVQWFSEGKILVDEETGMVNVDEPIEQAG